MGPVRSNSPGKSRAAAQIERGQNRRAAHPLIIGEMPDRLPDPPARLDGRVSTTGGCINEDTGSASDRRGVHARQRGRIRPGHLFQLAAGSRAFGLSWAAHAWTWADLQPSTTDTPAHATGAGQCPEPHARSRGRSAGPGEPDETGRIGPTVQLERDADGKVLPPYYPR
jgi:hypothetical protein